ncbi:hypothetical protein QMQ05_04085 [Glutamicibacter ectropisis]|uniref:Uncharacterized protein n=1 Tax=Glutamicibacter ectropisis TaxID=3046593 RepID=A0AAU6WG27_9MICC
MSGIDFELISKGPAIAATNEIFPVGDQFNFRRILDSSCLAMNVDKFLTQKSADQKE